MKRIIAALLLTAMLAVLVSCSFSYETSSLDKYIALGDYSHFSSDEIKAKYEKYIYENGSFSAGNTTNISEGKRAFYTFSVYLPAQEGGERTLIYEQSETVDEIFSGGSVFGFGKKLNGKTVIIGTPLTVTDLTLPDGAIEGYDGQDVELDIVFSGIYALYVSDADIEEQVKSYLSDRMYEIKRTSYDEGYTADKGDTVYALITGTDETGSPVVNDYYRFTIGEGDIAIEGFEEEFIGKYPGMSFYTPVFSVPEDFGTGIAGKNISFICTIEYIVPAFSDESVKLLYPGKPESEIPTAAEYEAEVFSMMRDYMIKMTASWEILADRTVIKKLPKDEVKNYSESRKQYIRKYIEYYAETYGITPDQYVQYAMSGSYNGQYVSFNTVDEYIKAISAEVEESAEEYVTACLIQYAILRNENMLISDEAFFADYADATAYNLGYANAEEYIYEYRSYYDATRAAAVAALKGSYYSELSVKLLVAHCDDIDF